MGRVIARVVILLALGGLAGCAAVQVPPPEGSPAAQAEGALGTQPRTGAVYHASRTDENEGIGVVPYAGNRLGDNPYVSEGEFY